MPYVCVSPFGANTHAATDASTTTMRPTRILQLDSRCRVSKYIVGLICGVRGNCVIPTYPFAIVVRFLELFVVEGRHLDSSSVLLVVGSD